MKVSVSIPEGDVAFLDEYAGSHGMASRSTALQRAIRLLKANELSHHYAAAFAEWAGDADNSADDSAWDDAVADGLSGD